MSTIREPSLGPIVGHTTSKSCRLWIRGSDSSDHKSQLASDRRTVGVLAVVKKGEEEIPRDERPVFYFRLHREFDRTGTFNLGVHDTLKLDTPPDDPRGTQYSLNPNTTYTVRMGSLSILDPFDDDEIVDSRDLIESLPDTNDCVDDLDRLDPTKSEVIFTTFPEPEKVSDELIFLLGSCRYPGLLWLRKRADRIFGPMLDHITNNPHGVSPRFVLMVGDQIYADMLNPTPIKRADTFEEFQERYHDAFGSRNMRRLLRQIPNYMILDDHEIEDNWAQDRIQDRHKRFLFHLAIGAYRSYQWSHSPRNYGERLYYRFECGGYPFFVLDVRTQRYKEDVHDSLEDNHMLGRPALSDDDHPPQIDVLCKWLKDQQEQRGNRPKFIVSSNVFVPNNVKTTRSGNIGERSKNESDSWPAFPETRKTLLDAIVSNEVQNVVFLSGDIHCSNVAEISFSGTETAEKLKAFSITSSAFYWPFPFADGEPSNYVHKSTRPKTLDTFKVNDDVTMDYEAYGFTQEDNFCQVEVNQENANIVVRVKDEGGRPVRRRDGTDLVSTLQLAPW